MPVERAAVVQSLAGHDRGGVFLVLESKDGALLIADGKNRRLARPKRKSEKHVKVVGALRGLGAAELTDRELRRALAKYRSDAGESLGGDTGWQKTT